jgi:hypothetical protein
VSFVSIGRKVQGKIVEKSCILACNVRTEESSVPVDRLCERSLNRPRSIIYPFLRYSCLLRCLMAITQPIKLFSFRCVLFSYCFSFIHTFYGKIYLSVDFDYLLAHGNGQTILESSTDCSVLSLALPCLWMRIFRCAQSWRLERFILRRGPHSSATGRVREFYR